jgi:hypothetical protein
VAYERSQRLAALENDIRARLRPVCQDWPPETFDEVVRNLVELTVKYEGHVSSGGYDRRSTERVLDDLRQYLERSKAARESSE